MVVRAFGVDGIAARIREHVRQAQVFRGWVEADAAFEVRAPSPLSVVCFRARFAGLEPAQADARNEALMEAVNETGEAYLSHTRLNARTVLRVAVGNLRTEERHLRRAWTLLQDHARRLATA
jgi:aromatic-L-amino-acid decarboxylase